MYKKANSSLHKIDEYCKQLDVAIYF